MSKLLFDDGIPSISNVVMGSILTTKIPWLLDDPRSILKKKVPNTNK